MQANETLLEFWIQILCEELGELSKTPITASPAPYETNRQAAYETTLLAEGPIQGELHIIVEAGNLIQFTQISSREPLDSEIPCDPERVETWRQLLNKAASKLSAKLTENFTDFKQSSCLILLADTHPLPDGDLLSGEPGSRIQRWLVQDGKNKIAVLARAKVEFAEVKISKSASADPVEIMPPTQADVDQQTKKSNEEKPNLTVPVEMEDEMAPTEASERAATERSEMAGKRTEPQESTQQSLDESKYGRPVRDFDDPVTSPEQTHRFDLLLDIELEATLRFGAIEMPLREVLELGPGDVLSLDRHVQEPVELVVGDRIVARGEVVLIGGNFGLHVTEVAEPRRRLETIRCLF